MKFAFMLVQGGGEFYTPSSVVKLLVEMIEPYEGTTYDPACGSGSMFVQAQNFVTIEWLLYIENFIANRSIK
jgi:type I restriction enzyme M protein